MPRTTLSKTEQLALDSIATKGFWLGRGKRAFTVAKGMQARNALPGARYSFEAFNGNGNCSQWNHPRFIACYEVSIHADRSAGDR